MKRAPSDLIWPLQLHSSVPPPPLILNETRPPHYRSMPSVLDCSCGGSSGLGTSHHFFSDKKVGWCGKIVPSKKHGSKMKKNGSTWRKKWWQNKTQKKNPPDFRNLEIFLFQDLVFRDPHVPSSLTSTLSSIGSKQLIINFTGIS